MARWRKPAGHLFDAAVPFWLSSNWRARLLSTLIMSLIFCLVFRLLLQRQALIRPSPDFPSASARSNNTILTSNYRPNMIVLLVGLQNIAASVGGINGRGGYDLSASSLWLLALFEEPMARSERMLVMQG